MSDLIQKAYAITVSGATGSGSVGSGGVLLGGFIEKLFAFVFPAAVLIGFIKIVLAGYTLMTSQGDPSQVAEGKEDVTAAILGMLFVLLSLGILRVLIGTLITGGSPGF